MLFHLQNIRDYVKTDFNQSVANSFLQETDIDRWVNEGYMHYAHRLMLAYGGYFEQTFGLDITSGQEAVALPTVFDGRGKHMKTILLERVLATERIPLRFHKRYNEANATQGALTGFSYLPTYKFRGNYIILEPTPQFTEVSSSTSGLLLTAQVMPARLRTGTSQAGGAASITLDSGADPRDSYYLNSRIYIISGTGAGQINTITAYVGSTKVATVSAWTTQPDSTSVYSILVHEDFPEDFHELLPLYALKCALGKERSVQMMTAHSALRMKELENEFKDFTAERTTARKFVQPWHVELF